MPTRSSGLAIPDRASYLYAVCSIGALANVSVASWIYAFDGQFYVAGLLGVLMSVVFNYSVTRVFTWR